MSFVVVGGGGVGQASAWLGDGVCVSDSGVGGRGAGSYQIGVGGGGSRLQVKGQLTITGLL